VLDNEDLASSAGLLQSVDPAAKLLMILLFAVTASLIQSAWLLAAMFVVSLCVAWASNVSPASFIRKVWASAGLLAVLLALPSTTAWVSPGTTLARLGPITLTVSGFEIALRLVLRVVASAGVALLIVWTTRWSDLLAALTRLRIPDIVVATLAMTQKQIVSLMRTVEQIHLARESRTLTRGTAAENRDWVTGRMAFVVQKSIKTADDVYDAMLARGFDGHVRSLAPADAVSSSAWLWLSATACLCAGIVILDRLAMPR
jgi:cobalt/nickel transport system permease protein